jgi:hypothetical protein
MKRDCYIITSAMASPTAPEKINNRFMETLHTVNSINAKDRNAEIFILETGSNRLPPYLDKFWSANVKVLNWQNHVAVIDIRNKSNKIANSIIPLYTFPETYSQADKERFVWHGYIKNVTEAWAIKNFFDSYDLRKYDKVFKISGRYCLSEFFNQESYNNKFSFKKEKVRQNGIIALSSVMWCFQGKYFDEFRKKWDNTFTKILKDWDNKIIADLENNLWNGFGDTEEQRQITYVDDLGVIGIVNFFKDRTSKIYAK